MMAVHTTYKQRTNEFIVVHEFIWLPLRSARRDYIYSWSARRGHIYSCVQVRIHGHMNSYRYMNSYYNCSYNLLTNIWIHINVWIYIMSVHTTLFAHVKTWARFHMYIWITMSHVINSLIITLNLLILIKFSQLHPTTSMRNWVCPHKSYCRAGCDGYSFSQQRGCDYHLKMEWECLLQCQDRNETRDETTVGSQSDVSTTSVPSFLRCSYPCRTWRRTRCRF